MTPEELIQKIDAEMAWHQEQPDEPDLSPFGRILLLLRQTVEMVAGKTS